jgi:protein-S-isoprenylcysteine O-methyltransferase Ste14
VQTIANRLIYWLWMGAGVVWLVSSLTAKTTARQQSAHSRLLHICIELLAFLLVFNSDFRIGPLKERFVPPSAPSTYIGLALTSAGIFVAIWARFFLGRNWSANVTVKQDHNLVRSGPYRVVRHPIYSGLVLGLLGTSVAVGEVGCLLGTVLALIGWRLKSLVEEQFMEQQFGNEYLRYKQEVKALIPFAW